MNSYAAMTDEDLMMLYYQEDEPITNEAFAEIDRRYRFRLILSVTAPNYNKRFLKLYKMPGMEQTGEELAAEALFKVADTRGRPAARWDPARKRVHAWIFGILRNVVVSYLRRQRPEVWTDTDFQQSDRNEGSSTVLETAATGVGPEEAVENEALMAALRECVRELPEQLRQLCELLFERGLKQTEAATELKMSTPTVTRRKQEVYDRLRRCMRRKGIVKEMFN